MINIKNISKAFQASGNQKNKNIAAVQDVSLCAEDGQVTGLLGANGAGKSTTLRVIAGLTRPDYGAVAIDGLSMAASASKVKKRIGYMPHEAGLYGRLTARENIEYFARLSGVRKQDIKQRSDALIELLDMTTFCDRRSEGFSQGQKTKVALARALVHSPKNLILDEPTNGLDVLATRNLREIIGRLRDQGHCILLSSHIMQEVTLLCDKVAIIDEGKLVIVDTVDQIIKTTHSSNFEDAFVKLVDASRCQEPVI